MMRGVGIEDKPPRSAGSSKVLCAHAPEAPTHVVVDAWQRRRGGDSGVQVGLAQLERFGA
jgi:hypothetical protein